MELKLREDGIYIRLNPKSFLLSRIKSVPGRLYYPDTKEWFIPYWAWEDLCKQIPEVERAVGGRIGKYLLPPEIDFSQLLREGEELLPFQKEGVQHLLQTRRCVLGDDMGLGKTIQALSALSFLFHNRKISRALVFCPSPLKDQWAREVNRFTTLSHQVVEGSKEIRKLQYSQDVDLLILNYELILHDYNHIARLVGKKTAIVLDEVQRLKSHKGKMHNHFRTLLEVKRPQYIFALTGTPLINYPSELYNITRLTMTSILGSWKNFESRYIVRGGWGQILYYRNLDELKERLNPILLRRTKKEVLKDLPPVMVRTYTINFNPQELRVYNLLETDIESLLDPDNPPKKDKIFRVLTLLRVFSSHPHALLNSSSKKALALRKEISKLKKFSKYNEFLDIVKDLVDGHKVLAFTEFARVGELLVEGLNKKLQPLGVPVYFVRGGQKNNSEIVSNFRHAPKGVLVSTDTLKYGADFPEVDVLINYDLPWSYGDYIQRRDRIYRIGQKNPVTIINLLIKEEWAVEQRVREVLGEKEDYFKALFN